MKWCAVAHLPREDASGGAPRKAGAPQADRHGEAAAAARARAKHASTTWHEKALGGKALVNESRQAPKAIPPHEGRPRARTRRHAFDHAFNLRTICELPQLWLQIGLRLHGTSSTQCWATARRRCGLRGLVTRCPLPAPHSKGRSTEKWAATKSRDTADTTSVERPRRGRSEEQSTASERPS